MDTRKKVASSTTNLHQDRGKDTNKIPQFKRLAQCFSENPKTMYQAEQETGIRIANICRFIDKMKKNGIIRQMPHITQASRILYQQPGVFQRR